MDDAVVQTTEGAVRGARVASGYRYLGIPYARTPRGPERFDEPRSAESRRGTWDATRFGATAPQLDMAAGITAFDARPYFGPGWVRGDDYLSVSIWAPAGGGDHPVLAVIPGGGLLGGGASATIWDGSAFARDGVVVAVIQHRLGLAGFLDLPDAPANRGLLDVLEALRWLGRNIASFGGDPGAITLLGESAGAILASAVLVEPGAEQLVRRVVMESGSGTSAFSSEQAARVTARAVTILGAANPGLTADRASLGRLSDDALVEAVPALLGMDLDTPTEPDPMVGLNPFGIVLPRQPARSAADGAGSALELLIGTNSSEGRFYLAPSGELETSTRDDVVAMARSAHQDPDPLIRAYLAEGGSRTAGELRAAILGDALFERGTDALVDARAGAGGRTFRYVFDWGSSAVDGDLGAAHVVELPFVFDRVEDADLVGPRGLLGPAPVPRGLATAMHASWVRFARTGDPGWEHTGSADGPRQVFSLDPHLERGRRPELGAWT